MADLLIDNESLPATPAAGKSVLFIDNIAKRLLTLDDAGIARGLLAKNVSIASQGPGFAADTWVTNSDLLIPSPGLQLGLIAKWFLHGSKTAAGVAAPAYTIRLGAARSIADTALLVLNGAVQTAVVDNGLLIITAELRSVGAAAVLAAVAAWAKTQAGTAGFGGSIDGVSAGFDSTGRAGQYLSLSINGGAAAAWTLTGVFAELIS
jgi:hypothetical protein